MGVRVFTLTGILRPTTDTTAVEEDRGEPSVVTDADAPAELDALPADPVEQA